MWGSFSDSQVSPTRDPPELIRFAAALDPVSVGGYRGELACLRGYAEALCLCGGARPKKSGGLSAQVLHSSEIERDDWRQIEISATLVDDVFTAYSRTMHRSGDRLPASFSLCVPHGSLLSVL